jgi:hypothetical protein
VRPRVAYVAAHHGRGHVTRAAAVLRHVRAEATLFSSADPPDLPPGAAFVRLPADDPRGPADVRPAGPLHYAPVGHDGLRRRMARLAAWAAEGPGLLVADVSAEVATFGRLLSLPVVAVRQHGRRWDEGHLLGYRLAARLLAPFPRVLDAPDAPAWVRAKTTYAGGFSRFDGRSVDAVPAPRTVVVMGGGGASGPGSAPAWTPADVVAAARATPDRRWRILGAETPPGAPPNLLGLGWIADPLPVLARAGVVVAHGGHNAVMEAATAGRPLVVVPAERPFEEQRRKAAALARIGAAVVRHPWPAPADWPGVLAEASALDPAPLRSLSDGHGARRAAALLDRLATTVANDTPTVRPVLA